MLFRAQDGPLEPSSEVVSTKCPLKVNDDPSDRKHHIQWDSYSEKFEIFPGIVSGSIEETGHTQKA